MTIPSILGSSTIGYKWENGYFPIKIALEWDSIVGDGVDWIDFTRRDVVEYSWIRDSDNLESNAGWMDGSGQVAAHITNQKIKDGAGNLTDILSYVQGQAVALSTDCNFELPIDGQHFVIKMYDFFN